MEKNIKFNFTAQFLEKLQQARSQIQKRIIDFIILIVI